MTSSPCLHSCTDSHSLTNHASSFWDRTFTTTPLVTLFGLQSTQMAAQKRKAPGTPEAAGRRRSVRVSSSGKKSKYFEGDTESDDEDILGAASDVTPVAQKKRGRGRPPKSSTSATKNATSSTLKGMRAKKVESDDEDDDDADEYKEEQDEDDEKENAGDGEYDDELGSDEEPRVTITPLAKMRDTGGVLYEDERVHKNTMLFLKDLKANNKRSWLKGARTAHQAECGVLVEIHMS